MRCDDPPPVPSHGIHFSLTRAIRAPLPDAFAWWTDYDPVDAKLSEADRLEERHIVSDDGTHLRKTDVNRMGPLRAAVDSVVTREPPDGISLVAESRLHGVRATYRFETTSSGCRLHGDFHVFARTWWMRPVLVLKRSDIERGLALEWDGYVDALEAELAPAPTTNA